MNTDNYDFSKSSEVLQDIGSYSPYTDKQANSYINDLNGGVYSANQSLVQIDLSSLFSASKHTNTNDMFICIPLTLVSCCTAGATTPAPNSFPLSGWALQSLKSGYHNLLHSADLQINGITVADTQPHLGLFTHIRLLSELSQNDLQSIGTSIGFSSVLDSYQSQKWGGAGGANTTGNGLTNNIVFGESTQATANQLQTSGVCNNAINERVLKTIDTTKDRNTATASNIVGNLVSGTQLRSDYKSVFESTNTKRFGVVYDVAIIRLKDIFDCMGNIGIIRRFGAGSMLRLYVNTGVLQVGCTGNATNNAYTFNVINSTFNNACPFTINHLGLNEAGGGIIAGITQITAGLFIGKALPTSPINLFDSGASHPMTSVRLYYSTIVLEPEKARSYSIQNQSKRVVYKNYYFNQINGVDPGATFSQLIQSGIKNTYALIIVPFVSSKFTSTAYPGTGAEPFGGQSGYQWQSPFDTSIGSPCILSQLQVQVGGSQVFHNPMNYGFENYLTEFNNSESLSSSDFGVSCGIVSREYWDANRIYYINLSRGTRSDMITPRNIVVSFKNESLCPIDLMVFTVYLDEMTINVDTGLITK